MTIERTGVYVIFETALLALLAGALLVLPGLGVRAVLRRPMLAPAREVMLGVALTPLVVALVALVLLGFSVFSPSRAGAALAAAGLPGLWRARPCALGLAKRPATYLIAVLAVPFAWSTSLAGAPGTSTFQWYYWLLGTQLSKANGIPSSVAEYGQRVRWAPDYLIFNTVGDAYRGLAPVGNSMSQIAAWRIPLALLGLASAYAFFRLWLRRPAALAGVLVLAPSVFFTQKFGAYFPEAYAAVLGLVAITIAVTALREGKYAPVLLAGSVLGVDLAVNAIAATAMGFLFIASVVVELSARRGPRAATAWRSLGAAAVLAVVVTVAMGWSLQGRALVFADAGTPHRAADGTDPTLAFIRLSTGKFNAQPSKLSLDQELSDSATKPWPDLALTSNYGIGLGLLTLGGIGFALRRKRRGARRLLAVLLVYSFSLAAFALYSALRYDTFVPRHTGLSRLLQYAPLVISALVAIAFEGAFEGHVRTADRRRRATRTRTMAVAFGVCGLMAASASALVIWRQFNRALTISPAGEAVLRLLEREARPTDIVVGNVGTRGLLAVRSGSISLLEGRQPFLEQPRFLDGSNKAFADAHRFFTGTGDPGFADAYGVDWIIVADRPALLGSTGNFGVPGKAWRVPGFRLDFARDGVRLFRRIEPLPAPDPAVGKARDLGERTAIVLAALIAAVAVGGLASRRRTGGPLPDVRHAPHEPHHIGGEAR